MAAAKPRLLRKTLIFFSPQSLTSFSTTAAAAAHLRKPNEADDARYLSLIPASLLGTNPKSAEKPLSVLKFLESRGLDDTHIAQLVSRCPHVLSSSVDKVLAPKFKLLQSLGMSGAEVAGIMEKTRLLDRSVNTHLVPRIEFLRSILLSDEAVVKVCKRSLWALSASDQICNKMLSIISIFKDLGFTDDSIRNQIARDPILFQWNPEVIRQATSRVRSELGVEYKSDAMYFVAVATLCRLDTLALASKFQVFKNFGWSMLDILAMLRCQPNCLLCKHEKLNLGLEFLMNTAGFSPSYLAERPTLLMMSLQSRVIPRFTAFSALRSKNLIREEQGFYPAACLSEESFLKKYIFRFEREAPEICEAYVNSRKLGKMK